MFGLEWRQFSSMNWADRSSQLSRWLAVGVAASLPWSTSAAAIIIALWAISALPVLRYSLLKNSVLSPAGGLPVLLWLIAAVAMVWADVTWSESLHAMRGFHKLLVLPFVLRSVYVSLKNLDQRFELAAASLGASPRNVLLTVTLPLLAPGLVSGWLFAAILSFNEFTASLFVTSQRTQTLPVAMYNYVREYADPSMAAVSLMYIVATATVLIIANAYLGLGKMLDVEHGR